VVDAGPVRSMSVPVSGVIPWGALSPEVKRVLHEGRERVAAGYGPGTALRGVTKRLGIKPCPGGGPKSTGVAGSYRLHRGGPGGGCCPDAVGFLV